MDRGGCAAAVTAPTTGVTKCSPPHFGDAFGACDCDQRDKSQITTQAKPADHKMKPPSQDSQSIRSAEAGKTRKTPATHMAAPDNPITSIRRIAASPDGFPWPGKAQQGRPGSRTLEIGQLHTSELTSVSDPDHRFGIGFSTDLWVYHLPLEHLREAVMLRADGKPVQSWRKIAAEAAKETDPKKLVEIIEKLCEALETIRLERSPGNPPSKPSKSTAA